MKRYLFFLCAIIISLSSLNVLAALPSISVDLTAVELSKTSKEPYFVIIPYGDSSIDYQVEGVSIKLTVDKPDLTIDPNNIFDQYNAADATKIINCNSGTEGNSYPIGVNFVTKNSLVYGPGSAKEGVKGSSISTLTIKRVGCLKIGLIPSKEARNNEIITISTETINSNEGDNKKNFFYTTDIPPQRTILLQIGTEKTCAAGQEYVQGRCVQTCPEGFQRGGDNNCQQTTITCPEKEEIVNKTCKKICDRNQFRTNFGNCKEEEVAQNILVSAVFMTIIVFIVIASIVSVIKRARKT